MDDGLRQQVPLVTRVRLTLTSGAPRPFSLRRLRPAKYKSVGRNHEMMRLPL